MGADSPCDCTWCDGIIQLLLVQQNDLSSEEPAFRSATRWVTLDRTVTQINIQSIDSFDEGKLFKNSIETCLPLSFRGGNAPLLWKTLGLCSLVCLRGVPWKYVLTYSEQLLLSPASVMYPVSYGYVVPFVQFAFVMASSLDTNQPA